MWGAGAVALVLVACGGGADTEANPAPSPATAATDDASGGLDIAGSVGDSDLLVPRDYLQGEWCSSDGQSVTVNGDTVQLEEGGGVMEAPVDLMFLDGPGGGLVSQTDDEFVVESGGVETTFTRGSC